MRRNDRKLGMDRPITRRDFLNGVAVTITGSLLSSSEALGALWPGLSQSEYYPPALTGLRGTHDGSWEAFHQMSHENDENLVLC